MYPVIQPYHMNLQVDARHHIYFEEVGNHAVIPSSLYTVDLVAVSFQTADGSLTPSTTASSSSISAGWKI